MKQWNDHKQHMDEHITWPATKKEIVAACQGIDVEQEVMSEIKTKLTEDDKKYTKSEVMNLLVM